MAQISRQCLTIPLGPSARSAITWTHHPKIIGKTVVPLTWVPLCNQPHIHLSGYLLGVPPTRGNSTAGRPSQGGPEPTIFPMTKGKYDDSNFWGVSFKSQQKNTQILLVCHHLRQKKTENTYPNLNMTPQFPGIFCLSARCHSLRCKVKPYGLEGVFLCFFISYPSGAL